MRDSLSPAETFIADVADMLRAALEPTLPDETVLRWGAETYASGRSAGRDRRSEFRAAFGEAPPLSLVAFDTPVQRYVFECERPIIIAGASAQVARLTERPKRPKSPENTPTKIENLVETEALPAGAIIYRGGGGGLLLVPSARACELVKKIESALLDDTAGEVRVAAVALPVWPCDLAAGKPYQFTTKMLLAGLQDVRARNVRIPAPAKRTRCEHCLVREADAGAACKACCKRMAAGRKSKTVDDEARHFGQIVAGVKSGREDAYLAVLYADGANVGAVLQRLQTLAQYREFSHELNQAIVRARDAAFAFLRKEMEIPESEHDRFLPWQVPICGGDDLLMVLPGPFAFDVAHVIGTTFEKFIDERFRHSGSMFRDGAENVTDDLRRRVRHLGLGIGIAVANYKFPFRYLRAYATELLKNAKTALRSPGSGHRTAIDFQVLLSGSPLEGSIKMARERLTKPGDDITPTVHLTARPYPLTKWQSLLDLATALSGAEGLGRSQHYALRDRIEAGWHESVTYWRYQHARSESGRGWAAFRDRVGGTWQDIDERLWEPHGDGGKEYKTRMVDAMEVLRITRGMDQ